MTRRDQLPPESQRSKAEKARAAVERRFQERLAEYQRLTRTEGLPPRVGITYDDAVTRYENELAGMTTTERRQARCEEYLRLRAEGVKRSVALRRAHIGEPTARRLEAAVGS